MKKELICISCPIGCRLEIKQDKNGSLAVSGNRCPKGIEYAREEINAPKRIVTTTVALSGENRGRVPVRTDKPLPVEYINSLLQKLHSMQLAHPIDRGSIVIKDYRNSGVDVISSFSVKN